MYMEKIYSATPTCANVYLIFFFLSFYFFASSLELLMALPLLCEKAAYAGAVGYFSKLFSGVPEVHLWVSGGIMRQAPTRKNHVRGNFSKVARTLPPA